jgi:predicted dienelactone hydrolase
MQSTLRGLLAPGLLLAMSALAADPPSRPGLDAPELARLGNLAVGVKTIVLVDRDQLDLLALDSKTGIAPKRDRSLTVDIWYPAHPAKGAATETYSGSMDSEPPAPPSKFQLPGIAVRNAPADAGKFPLVIVAHGYGNVTVGMTWLTENLASKGYVVAAIRHEDSYFNPAGFPQALLRRPLDIAFVTRELQRTLGDSGSVDPSRTALIGYSMGGYGVLAAGGAALDPAGPGAGFAGGLLKPYLRGGASDALMHAPAVKAIVAISPAGGSLGIWGANGLEGITAPLLLISGDHDLTVDYKTNARAFLDQATRSNRYLLTYLQGGHALGLGPATPEMQQSLWNQDWFEDPVWRKDRLTGINLHFITAFLDRYVKDDANRSGYLDGLVEESDQGVWQPAAETAWGAYSPGGEGVTLWKGFQRRHATGMTLMHREANAPAR